MQSDSTKGGYCDVSTGPGVSTEGPVRRRAAGSGQSGASQAGGTFVPFEGASDRRDDARGSSGSAASFGGLRLGCDAEQTPVVRLTGPGDAFSPKRLRRRWLEHRLVPPPSAQARNRIRRPLNTAAGSLREIARMLCEIASWSRDRPASSWRPPGVTEVAGVVLRGRARASSCSVRLLGQAKRTSGEFIRVNVTPCVSTRGQQRSRWPTSPTTGYGTSSCV
jgi:hypothetical protein